MVMTASARGKNGPYSVHELADAQKAHFAAALECASGRRVVYIAHNDYAAQGAYEDFNAMYGEDALFLPAREIMLYDVEAKDYDIAFRRVRALDRLLSGDYSVAVMSVDAAAQFVPPPGLFTGTTKTLAAGGRIDLDGFGDELVGMGYERVHMVEARGTFAVRGGILDVYPVDQEYAVRVELFDDEIDSIRMFDVQTQRTVGQAGGTARLLPARDILYSDGDLPAIVANIRSAAEGKNIPAIEEDIEKFLNVRYFAGMDRYLAFIFSGLDTPLSYASDCTFILDEPARAFQKLQSSEKEHAEICSTLIARGKLLPEAARLQLDFHELIQKIPMQDSVSLSAMRTASEVELLGSRKARVITGKSSVSYQGNVELLITDIRERLKEQWTVLLLTNSAIKAERLMESLSAERIPVSRVGWRLGGESAGADVSGAAGTGAGLGGEDTSGEGNASRAGETALPGMVSICYGALASGFEYPKIKLLVICDSEFQSGARGARRARKARQGEKISFFTDLRTGDYVVHQTHGIGVFSGIEQMKIDDAVRDYLKIRYKDGDILYIPTNQLDLVQKYVGSDARSPKVNSLNSTEWSKTKRRVKDSLKSLAAELILIYARRREATGFAYSPDTVWQRQFEEQFPYAETDDQLRSIEEIKSDMESPRLMDRLLCGDVGFGKTEVAIRAAFKAVTDGKQVAFLVPTTVLAQQHHQTFTERFSDFPISVDVLSRFRTAAEQSRITSALKEGQLDIVIGTHKLLNKNIGFKNLGLLVVDEEQRFGVGQKERIKALKPDIDVLSLSATPIPRTLHMSMTKIRDISILKDPPEERFPVQTFVMEYDEDVIREAILREAARSGQVFYLYNRVMGIDIKTMQVRAMLPDGIRIACAHGQMSNRELEDIMLAFVNREYDVLICTTIIESGLDIPNVNTIIVEDADHMGLAQLYQLRGRVGRSNRLAYAYITHRRDKVITEESEKRLAAIREFTELGAGFRIAMRDMEIRGVGNLLGVEQHGHMESVGYDMYCRLLDEAVRELERENARREANAGGAGANAAGGGGAASRSGAKASANSATNNGSTLGGSGAASISAKASGDGAAAAAVDSGIDYVAQVSLDLRINAYIDSLYIEDETLRLEMYQKIAAARSEDDIGDIIDEMNDRYSTMPGETKNLIKLARIKILAAGCGITAVAEKNGQVVMQINPNGGFDVQKLANATHKYKRRVLFSAGAAPYISLKTGTETGSGNPRATGAAPRTAGAGPRTAGGSSYTSGGAASRATVPVPFLSAAAPRTPGISHYTHDAPSRTAYAPTAPQRAQPDDIVNEILRFLGELK
ncbi:MAG: transcription-repair coupling factor [Oscillospiraceae bacterium]|nr:transcription-repair coupling factor [Oscillospiraceae bacterium]